MLSTEDIHERIRGLILEGELPPGSIVSQVAIARDLGTSRTPLREALRMLQSEGLIEGEPNRRVRVAPITASDLEELCVIRVTLEAEAVRLSVPLMTPEDIARMEGYIAEMDHHAAALDYRRWREPHKNFHRALTEHAGPRVNFFLSQMFDHAERYRRLHIGQGPTAWATSQHRGILNACKAGDRATAGALLAEHLARVGFEVSAILDPEYRPDRLTSALVDTGAQPITLGQR